MHFVRKFTHHFIQNDDESMNTPGYGRHLNVVPMTPRIRMGQTKISNQIIEKMLMQHQNSLSPQKLRKENRADSFYLVRS